MIKQFTLHESDIREICAPLFSYLKDIKVFTFCRFYYDQTVLILSTKGLLYNHFFEKNINFVMPLPEQQSRNRFHYLTTGEGGYQRVLHEAIANFGVAGSLNYVHAQPEYCDFYAFCVEESHLSYVNTLLAQLESLEKFCGYFREKVSALLIDSPLVTTLPPSMHINFEPIQHWTNENNAALAERFFHDIHLKSYKWHVNGISSAISNTEVQCLKLFLHGLSSKQVARELDLSSHTVNTYVRNIKQRFQFCSRSALLKLFEQSFLR